MKVKDMYWEVANGMLLCDSTDHTKYLNCEPSISDDETEIHISLEARKIKDGNKTSAVREITLKDAETLRDTIARRLNYLTKDTHGNRFGMNSIPDATQLVFPQNDMTITLDLDESAILAGWLDLMVNRQWGNHHGYTPEAAR